MLEVEHVSEKFKDHQVTLSINLKRSTKRCRVSYFGSIWIRKKQHFLRCLNHLEKADTGPPHPRWKEYDLTKLSKEILEIPPKRRLCLQHYNLFANKAALENILKGLVGSEDEANGRISP